MIRSIGSNTSTFANALEGHRIYAFLTSNEIQITNLSIVFRPGTAIPDVSCGLEQENIIEQFQIPPGEIHRLDRPVEMFSRRITLVYVNDSRQIQKICKNYNLPVNHSYIITKKGGLVRQAYGDPNRWKDHTTHVDHNPN